MSKEGHPKRLRKTRAIALVGLAATGIVETTLPSIASASEKPQTITASPAKNFSLQTPEQVFSVINAELLGKNKKGEDKEQAKAETKNKNKQKEQAPTMEEQLKAVAQSIDATLKMTPEEFNEWVYKEHEDGTTNELSYGGSGTGFNFPHVEKTSDKGNSTIININSATKTFTYDHLPGHVYPLTPQMSLVFWDPEIPRIGMLSFFNGSVTVPIENEGSATVSFGTQIWPDGKKIPFGWVSNFDLPGDPRFGPDQSIFTDQPQLLHTYTKNLVDDYKFRSELLPRADFLSTLENSVGKPIATYLYTDQALRTFRYYEELGGFQPRDLHIEGLDLFPQFSLYNGLVDSFFNQDPTAFDNAVAQGVESGSFLNANSTRREIRKTLQSKLEKITEVNELLSLFPWGRTVVFDDAIVPNPLQSK